MLSSRHVRFALSGVGLLLLLGVAWCAWTVWQVNGDLQDAVNDADAFQAAVEAGDVEAIERELAGLQDSSASAENTTSGPTWSLLTKVPVFGDDAQGVRTVSRVVHDLSQDGLEPLVAVHDQLDDLLPTEGTVSIDTIASLEEPVADAGAAFSAAEKELAGRDTSGYAGRFKDQYDELLEKVTKASDVIISAGVAVDVLPAALGENGARNYLLVFQNNAEIRATGGLPGAVSLVGASGGALSLSRQVTGDSFGRVEPSPLPLTVAERRQYDEVLGAYFLSSNMTPDFPRAADLWAARWEQEYPEERVDGVVAIDTVAVSYILGATGPITVDGLQLTADNVVHELLHNIYLRLDDPKDQDQFFADVAATAFDRFTNGATNPTGLIKALARATNEGRVNVHLSDDDDQADLADTAIAGEFVTDTDVERPQINVTVNDTTAAKMSYYLRYETEISATYCSEGVQGFSGKMRLTSEAPLDAADTLPPYVLGPNISSFSRPGNQWVTVRIYGPSGGTVEDATLNNSPLQPIEIDQDGRPVAMFYAELKPGQTVDVAWSMKSGPGQTGAPSVRVTPSIVAGEPAPTTSAC